jgi:hypothetical protein
MGDLLESLVQGSQKQTILCCWGWVVTNGFRAIAQHEMGGSVHNPLHSLGRQEWGDSMRVASGNAGSQEGVIVTFYIACVWEWGCAYMYKRTVMAMNLSELRS